MYRFVIRWAGGTDRDRLVALNQTDLVVVPNGQAVGLDWHYLHAHKKDSLNHENYPCCFMFTAIYRGITSD